MEEKIKNDKHLRNFFYYMAISILVNLATLQIETTDYTKMVWYFFNRYSISVCVGIASGIGMMFGTIIGERIIMYFKRKKNERS